MYSVPTYTAQKYIHYVNNILCEFAYYEIINNILYYIKGDRRRNNQTWCGGEVYI